MLRWSDLVAAGAATVVLTLGLAAAQARDSVRRAPDPVAAAVPAVPATATPEQRAEVGKAAAERIVGEAAPCARKIKVVYAGYGEGDRACAPR